MGKHNIQKYIKTCIQEGANLIMGPVEDKNHKGIGASAMAYAIPTSPNMSHSMRYGPHMPCSTG